LKVELHFPSAISEYPQYYHTLSVKDLRSRAARFTQIVALVFTLAGVVLATRS
jgi:hypothetical protein